MQLTTLSQISGKIELLSGLHIGSGNTEMHIGGTDSPVIKNPVNDQPYIPGSSLKGKMRSLMEWCSGLVGIVASQDKGKGNPLGIEHAVSLQGDAKDKAFKILKLFGYAPLSPKKESEIQEKTGVNIDQLISEIGPTRLSFWDCNLDPDWVNKMKKMAIPLTEVKMENMIDRIKGVAQHPRSTERVPAGACFDFRLTVRIHDGEDLLDDILRGLKLLELSGIGGSVSRGYGKIRFIDLAKDGESLMDRLAQVSV